MSKNKEEKIVVENRDLFNSAEVKMEKRSFFSILGYHLLSSILGLFVILQGVFSTSVKPDARNIFKWIFIGFAIALVLSLFISIRFYKNRSVLGLKKIDIKVNKILTYVYLVPIVGWLVLMMFSKKELSKHLASDGIPKDVSAFDSSMLVYRVLFYVAGALLIAIALSLFIYDLILFIKKDTKVSGEELDRLEAERQEALAKEGDLITDTEAEAKEAEEEKTEEEKKDNNKDK